MKSIFVHEYSLILLINAMNLTNTNVFHVHIVINGYNITFPPKQTLYFLPSQQFIEYSNLMTFLGLFSIHVFNQL